MRTHLLLDFDGTLADSSPGIFHSFSIACRDLNQQPPSIDIFRSLIGPPIQFIATKLYPELQPDELERFRQIFREDYDQRSFFMSDWYPGVHETICELSEDGRQGLCVVTNKPTAPALELISQAGLAHCFERVIGIDYLAIQTVGPLFPSKSEALSYAISSTSFAAEKRLYLGDTPSDQRACADCGIDFVAALYGFHQWSDDQIPAHSIDSFAQIKHFLSLT